MRVTLLSTDLDPTSGWGTVTDALCREFARRKDVESSVLLPQPRPENGLANLHRAAEYVLQPPVISFKRRPLRLLRYLLTRPALHGSDIVHSVVEFPYAITAKRLAAALRVPYVVSLHGTYAVVPFLNPVDRVFYKRALLDADVLTAPSSFTADAFRRASGIDREVRVVGDPVDVSRMQKPHDTRGLRQGMGISNGARIVLSVGGYKGRKGYDDLVRAFVRVIAHEPEATLVMLGPGPGDELRQMAQSVGISANVVLPGRLSGHELVGLYQACEVFAMLPRVEQHHFEGFGIVYLEAGACGKPVVGTRSGGVPEAVRDGETGILVAEQDYEGAGDAILRLLRESPLAQSMGGAGRRWAEQNDLPRFADRLLDVYASALASSSKA